MEKKPIVISLSNLFLILAIIIIIIMGYFFYQMSNENAIMQEQLNTLNNQMSSLQQTNNNLATTMNTSSSNNLNEEYSNSSADTNKVVLSSSDFKDWKISPNPLEGTLVTLTGHEEKEDDLMSADISIYVYKIIDSSNITNVKDYIAKHKFDNRFIAGDDMNFNGETSVNSNQWLTFSETYDGSYRYKNMVYATNQQNNLYMIRVTGADYLYNKYQAEVNEIVHKIQSAWDLSDGNNFNIEIK